MTDLTEVNQLLDRSLVDHTRSLRAELDLLRLELDRAYEYDGADSEPYQIIYSQYLTALDLAFQIKLYLQTILTNE